MFVRSLHFVLLKFNDHISLFAFLFFTVTVLSLHCLVFFNCSCLAIVTPLNENEYYFLPYEHILSCLLEAFSFIEI